MKMRGARSLFLTALVFLGSGSAQAHSLRIEGVDVPGQCSVGGHSLHLNGAGLRTFSMFAVPIKVYVASFYSVSPLKTEQDVRHAPGPMQFDFSFLRSVGQMDVRKAWTAQFAQSVSYTYPGYPKDRDSFVSMFGGVRQGGVERVQLIGTNTLIFDSGSLRGTIPGRNFQKAFLSLWFGSKPVSKRLKSQLLGALPNGSVP